MSPENKGCPKYRLDFDDRIISFLSNTQRSLFALVMWTHYNLVMEQNTIKQRIFIMKIHETQWVTQ